MWNELKGHYEKLSNNIKNIFSRGSLNIVTNAPTATMQVQLMADETYDGLEFPQDYGFISNPPPGSQVIAGFFGGNRDHGTVLKAFHTQFSPQTLASGEVALYHKSGSIIHLKADGSVEIISATAVNMTTPTFTLNGNLVVNGAITATEDITDNTGSNSHTIANMRSIYNGHTHPDPQGGNTDVPNQDM